MVYLQHCYITGSIRFCPEICHVGGRLIAAPTRSVPLNYRAEISGRCRGGATRSKSKSNDRWGVCRNQKGFSGVFQEGAIQYHHTANRPQDDAVLPYVFIASEQHTVFLGESDSGGRKRYPAAVSGFGISPLLPPPYLPCAGRQNGAAKSCAVSVLLGSI